MNTRTVSTLKAITRVSVTSDTTATERTAQVSQSYHIILACVRAVQRRHFEGESMRSGGQLRPLFRDSFISPEKQLDGNIFLEIIRPKILCGNFINFKGMLSTL